MTNKNLVVGMVIALLYCDNSISGFTTSAGLAVGIDTWSKVDAINYTESPLTRMRAEIKSKYIGLASRVVAERSKNKATSLSVCFEKDFLADLQGDEIPGNQRKNKKLIKKIREIYREQGGSEIAFSVVEFREDIAEDFVQKEQELIAQHKSYCNRQVRLGIMTAAGVLTMGGSAVTCGVSRDKTIGLIIGLAGAILTTAGGACLYSISGEQERLEINREEIQKMGNKWQIFFDGPNQQKK